MVRSISRPNCLSAADCAGEAGFGDVADASFKAVGISGNHVVIVVFGKPLTPALH